MKKILKIQTGRQMKSLYLSESHHSVDYSIKHSKVAYRKISKISPSMYKPLQKKGPQTGNAKNPPLNRPSKYKSPGGCTSKIALKYKVKR